MNLNNFLVESFLIGISLVIGFQLQSAITQIFQSFFNIHTLWLFNLCGLMTPYLIYTVYDESVTRIYG